MLVKNTESDIFEECQDVQFVIHQNSLVNYVNQKLLLFLLKLVMRDETSVDVLVHDLVDLPVLAAVDSVYQALRRFHSLDCLLNLLISYLVLRLDNVNELEVIYRYHLLLLFLFGFV